MDKETRVWQEISVAFISLSHHSNSSEHPKICPSTQPKGGDAVCMADTFQHVLTHNSTLNSNSHEVILKKTKVTWYTNLFYKCLHLQTKTCGFVLNLIYTV